MEQLLEYIITEITGKKPLSIDQNEDNGVTVFTITVPKEHMGTLIGKNGRMITAIRTLARTRGAKDNLRVNVELKESDL